MRRTLSPMGINPRAAEQIAEIVSVFVGFVFLIIGVILLIKGYELGFSLFAIGIGSIALLFGFVSIIKKRTAKSREADLRTNGTRIEAIYKETVENKRVTVNQRHPYYVVCEWVDPEDDKKYTFKSDNMWFNPRFLIKKHEIGKFPVYINMADKSEYVVDYSFLFDYDQD